MFLEVVLVVGYRSKNFVTNIFASIKYLISIYLLTCFFVDRKFDREVLFKNSYEIYVTLLVIQFTAMY